MDSRKQTKVRDIMETISKLRWNGLVMWREEQTTVGQPALHSGRPGDTQGTDEDQERDGGTI